jgi:hypothetical protein
MDSPGQYAEKRGAPRVPFSGVTIVTAGGARMTCLAGDLSESGISLYPQGRRVAAPADALHLAFALPQLRRWVRLDGTVVRETLCRRSRRPLWGVRFEGVPHSARAALRCYVQQRSTASLEPPRVPSPTRKGTTLRPDPTPPARSAAAARLQRSGVSTTEDTRKITSAEIERTLQATEEPTRRTPPVDLELLRYLSREGE